MKRVQKHENVLAHIDISFFKKIKTVW